VFPVLAFFAQSLISCLQFQDFELEDAHDWVEVCDGLTDSDRLFERFSGSQLPKIITSTSSGLFVRFKTDFTYSMRGFNATYTTGKFYPLGKCYTTGKFYTIGMFTLQAHFTL